MNLYITEQGCYVKVKENQIIVKKEKEILREIPLNNLESITIVGNAQVTTQAINVIESNGISLNYVSKSGYYKYSLVGYNNFDVLRLEKQLNAFSDKKYCLKLAKVIIESKVANQILILRRYNRNLKSKKISEIIKTIKIYKKKILICKKINELNGIEGIISKYYFSGLKLLIPKEFNFKKRVKRPATDPFNSLLNFGYTLLLNEIMVCLYNKKLLPYKGFMHSDDIGHPTLASDLMEEYRPFIVDTMLVDLVKRKIIKITDFTEVDGHFYINKEKKDYIINKFYEKISKKRKYLNDFNIDIRTTIFLQIESLINSMEEKDHRLFLRVRYR